MPGDCPASLLILLFVCGKHSLQAERHSGSRQRLYGLPPESVFSFKSECCSESQRNPVRLQTGIAFTFDRIPHRGWAQKEKANHVSMVDLYLCRQRPTLPHTFACSTIGPAGLNFRVRDGNGWIPRGKITDKSEPSAISRQLSANSCLC
jgi:hypothetical protein